jgi:hypothetical protein
MSSIVLLSAACSTPLADLIDFASCGSEPTLAPATDTPEPTPPPTFTPIPFGDRALELLDSLPSLATTRQRLQAMQVMRVADGAFFSGQDILRWILIDQQYDPGWSNDRKEDLLASLDGYDFPSSGQRIFILTVAQGLALDARGLVPWSLQNYSAWEINNLYIEDTALHVTNPDLDRGTLPVAMPNLFMHIYPLGDDVVEAAHVGQYHLAKRLIGDAASHSDAIAALVVWMQQNFFHAYEDYPWDVYLDGRPPRSGAGPAAFPLSLERIYDERVVGCHEPVIMLEGMLHSLNIPAVRLSVHGHGVLYLPTLDRYIHGDHVANYTATPPGVMFLTHEEFRPYAEDVAWIFQIYFDKYDPPITSVPLHRDGDVLYIHARNIITRPDLNCVEISFEDWTWLSQQLEAYNIFYDTVDCELTSDRVPILTLQALSAPAE